MNNDFDFIKDKMDNSGVNAPEDMGEDFALKAIQDVEPKPVEVVRPKRSWVKITSIAASVVLVLALSISLSVYFINKSAAPQTLSLPGGLSLRQFRSYDELRTAVKSLRDERAKNNFADGISYIADYMTDSYAEKGGVMAAEDSAAVASAGADGASTYSSFSETYKQVEGVDEADIIKTDGRYIYCVDSYMDTDKIKIFAPNGDSDPIVLLDVNEGDISTPDESEPDSTASRDYYYYDYGENFSVKDIYIKDDRLIAVCQDNGNYDSGTQTVAKVFDVGNIDNIALLGSNSQSGYYTSSRMIGDELYTVSSFYTYSGDPIPYCGGDMIDISCIYSYEKPEQENYLVVSAFDTVDFSTQTESKAIFGAADNIYCNLNNLYIYSTYYDYEGERRSYYAISEVKTRILKVELNDGLSFTAYAQVDGYADDQYAFDEYNGNLRVATTSTNEIGNTVNNMYVFDENLDQLGKVSGFAPGESIKAVRYVGDTAYVITYVQTDPLFVIDLSDPTAPEILGEVEITGFSTMLVPIDENTLLGIGYHTESADYTTMEVQEGLKLALFDVSDKTAPKVLDSISYVDFDSSVQYDPKALVYNPERGDFVIPLNYHHYEYVDDDLYYEDGAPYGREHYEYYGGMLNFKVDGDKLIEIQRYRADYDEDVERCVYIDDTVYMTHIGYDGLCLDSVEYK